MPAILLDSERTERLLEIRRLGTIDERLAALLAFADIASFVRTRGWLRALPAKQQLALLWPIALGQEHLFLGADELQDRDRRLSVLAERLHGIDLSYEPIGGLVGYHSTVLKLIKSRESPADVDQVRYLHPPGVDLQGPQIDQKVFWGLQALPQMAEVYPVGGAGDRLGLLDLHTGDPVPVARLPFCGMSMLAGLVRDVQGREYLYFKIFGRQLTTPIALMTSDEKDNHRQIMSLCEEARWFGRSQSSFRFCIQGPAPVITEEGDWAMEAPLQPIYKPGGHGVLWRVMDSSGIFDWLVQERREKLLVRQINNPVAGVDSGLLAFCGVGWKEGKAFGFAACQRKVGAAEGTDVLVERRNSEGVLYSITNIEYCEFAKHGIADVAENPDSAFSTFPANTNILFADLGAVREKLKECPFPGLLINMKKSIETLDREGNCREIRAGRLEATMQNIADCFVTRYSEILESGTEPQLDSFLTYNERRKTISVTKNQWIADRSMAETPEGCYYDLQANARKLLAESCQMQMPTLVSEETYLSHGPSFHVLYHPALGPLYSVICQKIKGGRMAAGSELQLEVAELLLDNLDLEGSLLITARSVLGDLLPSGYVSYSNDGGKCRLCNIRVRNRGFDPSRSVFWNNAIVRHEALQIILEEDAEFDAEGVTFEGGSTITVPAATRLVARQQGDQVVFESQKIEGPTWYWKYKVGSHSEIQLTV